MVVYESPELVHQQSVGLIVAGNNYTAFTHGGQLQILVVAKIGRKTHPTEKSNPADQDFPSPRDIR